MPRITEQTIRKFESAMNWHDCHIGDDPDRPLRGIHTQPRTNSDGTISNVPEFTYRELDDERLRKRRRTDRIIAAIWGRSDGRE